MSTRRSFLMNVGWMAQLPLLLETGEAQSSVESLPDGIIEPFSWGARRIPVSGPDGFGSEAIEKAVVDAMRKQGIVGAGVSVVRDSRIVFVRGFGFAELPDKPFLPTTASRCGSVAKPITALSALMLADQGKLDLDARILPLLKEMGVVPKPLGGFEVDKRIAQITVRHLMDHTSGFPGGTAYTAWRADRNVAARYGLAHVATGADVSCDALGNSRLDFDPGTRYQYANANFVLLARVIEAKSKMAFNTFLGRVFRPRFGLSVDDVYVSQNQDSPKSAGRGKNEAAYYQTSGEKFVSFNPTEQKQGRIYGEAYRGYATESSDGAGGIACTAMGLGKILANLHSSAPAISGWAIRQILTPPAYTAEIPNFNPMSSSYYSKGFDVRFSGGRPWLAHGGMTIHCGGVIGHNAGYQFAAVSNWNNHQSPFADGILQGAIGGSVGR